MRGIKNSQETAFWDHWMLGLDVRCWMFTTFLLSPDLSPAGAEERETQWRMLLNRVPQHKPLTPRT